MGARRGAGSILLIALMALGSVLMWIGAPLFWIWFASRLSTSTQPSATLLLLIVVGIAVSAVVLAVLLGRLNHAHQALAGRQPRQREQTIWLRSLRGERDTTREHGVLGTVMAVSVSLALAAMAVWFLFFAEGGGI